MNRSCTCQPTHNSCGKPACRGKQHRGCSGLIDTSCVYYHLDNNKPSLLRCTNIKNGTSLEKILEVFDQQICLLKGPDWSQLDLFCLRADYPIRNLTEFAQAVAAEICRLRNQPPPTCDCPEPEPLVVEHCDEFIQLSITGNKIKACLDFDKLLEELLKHKCLFDCTPVTPICSISGLTITTKAIQGTVTSIPIQFTVTNPSDSQVVIQLLTPGGSLVSDSRVPYPQQIFSVTTGLNQLSFQLQPGNYNLGPVRVRIQIGTTCSALSDLLTIQVGQDPFLTLIGSECDEQSVELTIKSVTCDDPVTPEPLTIKSVTCDESPAPELTFLSATCSNSGLAIQSVTC